MNAVADKPAPAASAIVSPAPRRRRIIRPLIGLLVLVGAAGGGYWWWTEGRFWASTDNAYVQADIAVLGPRIEGDVLTIHVADNQPVHAGDPLITLDPSDWQARFDQARSTLSEDALAVETARHQVAQSRAALAQSAAMIAQADAELTRATAEAGRAGSLSASGWSSRQSNETAVADRRKAEAGLAAAQAQAGTLREALGVAEAQVSQAEARRQTAAAALRLAQNNVANTVIRAPFDGIAGNRAAQLGQHVQPGLQLISVTPVADRLYVMANFKETQLRQMRPGQLAVLTPDIDTAETVSGHVESIAPATGALYSLLPPENATGNFTKVVQRVPVKIVLDTPRGWLRAGLSVTAAVDLRDPPRSAR